MTTHVVILAAGQGKRMQSKRPKVLHHLAGMPLLEHVIRTALHFTSQPIVICGTKADQLKASLQQYPIKWISQEKQLGTGHAVLQALPHLNLDDKVLILCGDVPLITVQTLTKLIADTPTNGMGMLTANLANPQAYGRIKRDKQNKIISIIEAKDASEEELKIQEINPGIYFVTAKSLQAWLPQLKNTNSQNEYYLTDIINMAVKNNVPIHSSMPTMSNEIMGANDCYQLAMLERSYQEKQARQFMQAGVTLLDPARVDFRGEITIGHDVIIDINVILEGKVSIGDDCRIGANTIIRNTVLKDNVTVKENCIIEGATLDSNSVVGPFARIRPDTKVHAGAHVGNFVEIKNSQIGVESKVNHLSYIGDSEVGKRVNIGAGTITCNYDGANKHKTIIGDDVQIGSDTQLVAPVTIGESATIAAGSTITKDVPPNYLTVTQALNQRTIKDWQRPIKKGS